MPLQINIKDDHIDALIEFYGLRLKEVREKKKGLEAEEKEYEDVIAQLLKKPIKSQEAVVPIQLSTSLNGYMSNWPIHEKIKYVLKKQNKALSTREVLDHLYVLDPALNADKVKTDKNVSTVLSIKKDVLWKRKTENNINKFELI